MPFKDLSEAKDREYLAEGIAEEIGTVLSRLPTLRVIGRASALDREPTALLISRRSCTSIMYSKAACKLRPTACELPPH